MNDTAPTSPALSLVKGPPLSEEPGLGALTLPGFFREVTQRYAQREALVYHTAEGTVRWSYDELYAQAMTVARALVACGSGKDERVGVLMTNRPEWIAAVFGVSLAGGVVVALNTFSTPPELEYMLQASGVSTLLFERHVGKKDFAEMLDELEPALRAAKPGKLASTKFPFLRRVAVVGDKPDSGITESWSDFLAHGKAVPQALIGTIAESVKPSDTGVLFFSSGSTAKPKGIFSAHRSVALQCWRWPRWLALKDDVRCWAANAFFWSGNFGMALGATLASGGTLVLQSMFDAAEALQLMQDEKVTLPIAWPHQWAQIEAAPNWKDVDLSSIVYIDPSYPLAKHPTVTTNWVEPKWAYGNTETFTLVTCYPSDTPPQIAGKSHGAVLAGNTIKIVDPETGKIVPRGERGEIAVKGATLMLGYLGIPLDETLDSEGFFATGDGGYIDEKGRLYWEGRLTDIIKTGGANVSPLEIDAAAAQYPGIKAAKAVGVPHETLGEIVVLCVVPHEGETLDADAIRAFLKERLAAYKVPRRVLFFREDELSLTGSAKIKSAVLRELAAKRLADA